MDPTDAALADETVLRLVALAEVLKITADDLDDTVDDCAAERACRFMNQTADDDEMEEILCEWEDLASDVNNSGLEAQIEFLMRYGSAAEMLQDFVAILEARPCMRHIIS